MYCPYNNATYPTGYCKPGYFCEKGSDTDRPETNHTGIAGPCTPGNYCPENTTYPLPCPKGRYSNQTHLKEPTDCNLCIPGSYCETPGLEEPSGQCDAGFYCLYGSELKNPPTVTSSGGPCPVGHYCTNGTSYPLSCDPGTFNDRTGQSECDKCCEGFYCPKNTTTCVNECPVGHYCPKEHPNLTPIHVLSERTAIKQDEQAKVIVLRVILECIAQTLDELNRTISAMVVGIVVEVHGQTHR